MDLITWPVAASIIGACVTFFVFLNNYLKTPSDKWQEPIEEVEKKIAVIETKIENIEGKILGINGQQKETTDRVIKRMDDLESKIDKFVDVLINYFTKK